MARYVAGHSSPLYILPAYHQSNPDYAIRYGHLNCGMLLSETGRLVRKVVIFTTSRTQTSHDPRHAPKAVAFLHGGVGESRGFNEVFRASASTR